MATNKTKYPCAKAWAEVYDEEAGNIYVVKLRCGSWKCVHCAGVNAAVFRRKIRDSLKAWVLASGYDPAKFLYWGKFLTLTLPGNEFRSKHSPEEGEKILKASWRKLRNWLKRKYGNFDFIQVDELQPSGFPHLHVLLLGKQIAPKEILADIRKYWVGKLGMGNIDLVTAHNIGGIASYLTKYISKSKTGVLKKGNRVYSFSKGLNDLIKSQKAARAANFTLIRLGFLNSDGTRGKVFWEILMTPFGVPLKKPKIVHGSIPDLIAPVSLSGRIVPKQLSLF